MDKLLCQNFEVQLFCHHVILTLKMLVARLDTLFWSGREELRGERNVAQALRLLPGKSG